MKSGSTLTIRNVPMRVVRTLKALARRNQRSMEQEVREMLDAYVDDRAAVLRHIEHAWNAQTRRPTSREIDTWIKTGRE